MRARRLTPTEEVNPGLAGVPASDDLDPNGLGYGYTTRWRQRGEDFETTGQRVYHDRAEVMRLCKAVMEKYPEIEQWCVKWILTEKGKPQKEVRQYHVK